MALQKIKIDNFDDMPLVTTVALSGSNNSVRVNNHLNHIVWSAKEGNNLYHGDFFVENSNFADTTLLSHVLCSRGIASLTANTTIDVLFARSGSFSDRIRRSTFSNFSVTADTSTANIKEISFKVSNPFDYKLKPSIS